MSMYNISSSTKTYIPPTPNCPVQRLRQATNEYTPHPAPYTSPRLSLPELGNQGGGNVYIHYVLFFFIYLVLAVTTASSEWSSYAGWITPHKGDDRIN